MKDELGNAQTTDLCHMSSSSKPTIFQSGKPSWISSRKSLTMHFTTSPDIDVDESLMMDNQPESVHNISTIRPFDTWGSARTLFMGGYTPMYSSTYGRFAHSKLVYVGQIRVSDCYHLDSNYYTLFHAQGDSIGGVTPQNWT